MKIVLGGAGVNYLSFDLKYQHKGAVVSVELSAQAYVRLMDFLNFADFRAGIDHKFYGGYATRSPSEVVIPKDGHWYVVVDTGDQHGKVAGKVTASVTVKKT